MNPYEDLEPHEIAQVKHLGTCLLAYRGSVAHGMYVPDTDPNSIDDVDLMGVYVESPEFYLVGGGKDVVEAWVGKYDTVSYEIRKFFNLLLGSNPNVLSMLWLSEDKYLDLTTVGKEIVKNRALFSSKKAYQSFSGYAYGQIKRMANAGTERYATGYLGAKRKGLVEKFGYDCKNAAHALRLLRMGGEFLRTGEFFVDRKAVGDADELLAVKRGEWTLERVKETADKLFSDLESAVKDSKLPDGPDSKAAKNLLMDLLCSQLASNVVYRSEGYKFQKLINSVTEGK
jgi:predicted nucleotidyltransferase